MTAEPVTILRTMIGICGMSVCAAKDATDADIIAVCNRLNPSGTSNGWGTVVRDESQSFFMDAEGKPNDLPVTCKDDPNRLHLVVLC